MACVNVLTPIAQMQPSNRPGRLTDENLLQLSRYVNSINRRWSEHRIIAGLFDQPLGDNLAEMYVLIGLRTEGRPLNTVQDLIVEMNMRNAYANVCLLRSVGPPLDVVYLRAFYLALRDMQAAEAAEAAAAPEEQPRIPIPAIPTLCAQGAHDATLRYKINDSSVCTISFDDLTLANACITPCMHAYKTQTLITYFQQYSRPENPCPYCRKSVDKVYVLTTPPCQSSSEGGGTHKKLKPKRRSKSRKSRKYRKSRKH